MAKRSGSNSLVLGIVIVLLGVGAIIMLSKLNTTIAPEKTEPTSAPLHSRSEAEGGDGLIEGDTDGKPMIGVDIAIENFAYSRPTFTVKKGTTVTWQNNDTVAHTVTAKNGSFDSGRMEKGKTFTHTFDTVGTFDYYCTPHPNMTAKIVVE